MSRRFFLEQVDDASGLRDDAVTGAGQGRCLDVLDAPPRRVLDAVEAIRNDLDHIVPGRGVTLGEVAHRGPEPTRARRDKIRALDELMTHQAALLSAATAW